MLPIHTHSLDDDVMATVSCRAAATLVAGWKSTFDALWAGLIFPTFGRLKTKKLVRMAGPRQNFMFLLAGTWNIPATIVLFPPKRYYGKAHPATCFTRARMGCWHMTHCEGFAGTCCCEQLFMRVYSCTRMYACVPLHGLQVVCRNEHARSCS